MRVQILVFPCFSFVNCSQLLQLCHAWNAPTDIITFVLTLDIATKNNKAKGIKQVRHQGENGPAKDAHHHQVVGAVRGVLLVRPTRASCAHHYQVQAPAVGDYQGKGVVLGQGHQ